MDRQLILLGSDLKLAVDIDKIGGKEVDDFTIELYCKKSKTVTPKVNYYNIETEDGHTIRQYYVFFNTQSVGLGNLRCKVTANIQDGQMTNDNIRTEIGVIDTGITIINPY